MNAHVIKVNGRFRRLWTARAVSFLGDSVGLVALMLHVESAGGKALALAALLLVGDFAPALLGPLTGAVSDRFDLRRVMICCELLQGLTVLVIVLWLPSLPWLLVLVAVRAIAGQTFQPASRAIVPVLVDDRDLPQANAAIGFGTNGGEALGPLVAAALFPFVGVRGVLLVDAATFLLSALLLVSMPSVRPSPKETTSLFGDALEGLRFIWGDRLVRAIGLGFFAVVAFNGIDDVALVLFAKDTLGQGDSAVGILLAAVGIGLFVGYLLLNRVRRFSMPFLLLAGFAISSAGNLLTGLTWAVAAAFLVQAIRGLGIAAMDVAAGTLLQRSVPGPLLGRVFGTFYGAIGVAAALSYAWGGLLLDVTSPPTTFMIAGAGGLITTLLTGLMLRRSSDDGTSAKTHGTVSGEAADSH
ncbi:MFS transporter [Actinocorallia sp. B10E7]|uniref:MFS transporter n=1 Tax=Actinocorallia sp. B10E7 TaxID=3153558 RepID=UPI00325F6484